MTVSLLDIASKTTPSQALALLLSYLTTSGLPATAWQEGSVPRALLEGESIAYADAMNLAAAIANGNILDLSAGEWLTQLAANMYRLDRKPALFAQGTVRITNTSGSIFSAGAGTLLASSTQSSTAFRITTAIVALASGSFVDVAAQAEEAGLSGNVAVDTISSLLTPYPGIAISNPGVSGVWLTQVGTREETDVSLRTRCRARWPQQGGGKTLLAYEGWALSVDQVTQARVFPNRDLGGATADGKIVVIIAGDSNPLDNSVVMAVAAYLLPRASLCTKILVDAATAFDVPISLTVSVQTAFLATTQAAVDDAIRTLIASKKIGERLYRAEIVEAAMSVPGAGNVVVTSPASDLAPPDTAILSLLTAPSITVAPLP